MAEFLQTAARFLDEPLLAQVSMSGWKDALVAVTDRWKGPGKLLLVLDEFQWIVGASPELPSVLQELWDMRWKARGDIVLILCGSYLGFMEKEVLGEKSPLHGRRTAQILLGPLRVHGDQGFPSGLLAGGQRPHVHDLRWRSHVPGAVRCGPLLRGEHPGMPAG
jgi:hypothetical protein